jgi:hypothetical protein
MGRRLYRCRGLRGAAPASEAAALSLREQAAAKTITHDVDAAQDKPACRELVLLKAKAK